MQDVQPRINDSEGGWSAARQLWGGYKHAPRFGQEPIPLHSVPGYPDRTHRRGSSLNNAFHRHLGLVDESREVLESRLEEW